MNWKTMDGTAIELLPYITNYLAKKPDTILLIGSDSQNFGKRFTKYAYAIVLYSDRKGGHVICAEESIPQITGFYKLFREVEKSFEIANHLREAGITRPMTVDLDLNPDPKYQSNKVMRQVLGWGEALGYIVRFKPYAQVASYVADSIVKRRRNIRRIAA